MPNFVTAVLPTPFPGQPTSTFEMPAPAIGATAPTLSSSIEGTTTSQLNVRAQPSTASATLGTINIFTKIQIIGQDSTGSWYQIAYADSSGWVRAEYAQVNSKDGIPIVSAAIHSSASGMSALVTQKINVRKGPGTNFESLGALNPNDVIFVIGKDSSGAWAQIEFAAAPDQKGWAAVEFLKMDNADTLPIVGAAEQPTATPPSAESARIFPIAMQDGDTMQAPLGTVVFSPAGVRSLQLNNDVSAPSGDMEDWLQFSSYSHLVAIRILCSGSGLRIDLWNDETLAGGFPLACGSEKLVKITPNDHYFLRLSAPDSNEFHYTNYIVRIENVQ